MSYSYVLELQKNDSGKQTIHNLRCEVVHRLPGVHFLGNHESGQDAFKRAKALGLSRLEFCNHCLSANPVELATVP